MSSNRSLTRSQARSLLSIARLKMTRSRYDRAISRRTRMDQTCFGSRGLFWPMSNPLFQGRWTLPTGRTSMAVSFATPPSASLYGEHGIIATNAPSLAPTTISRRPLMARSDRSPNHGHRRSARTRMFGLGDTLRRIPCVGFPSLAVRGLAVPQVLGVNLARS